MTVFISKSELPRLFTSRSLILVDVSLVHLVPTKLGHWDMLTFNDHTIGGQTGESVPLDQTRLPLAVALVVERAGSSFGTTLKRLFNDAGHPLPPVSITIPWWKMHGYFGRTEVATAIRRAKEHALSTEIYSPLQLNREIVQLRQQLERERLRNDRLRVALSNFGMSSREIVIDNLMTPNLTRLKLPLTQDSPTSLRYLEKIGVFDASNAPSDVQFDITIAGQTAYSAVIRTPGKAGWLHIPLPEALIFSAADTQFHLRALTGDPTLAGQDGEFACRMYWSHTQPDSATKPATAIGVIRSRRRSGVLRTAVWLNAGTAVQFTTEDIGGLRSARLDLRPHGKSDTFPGKTAVVDRPSGQLSAISAPAPAAGRYDVLLDLEHSGLAKRTVEWTHTSTTPLVLRRHFPSRRPASPRYGAVWTIAMVRQRSMR